MGFEFGISTPNHPFLKISFFELLLTLGKFLQYVYLSLQTYLNMI